MVDCEGRISLLHAVTPNLLVMFGTNSSRKTPSSVVSRWHPLSGQCIRLASNYFGIDVNGRQKKYRSKQTRSWHIREVARHPFISSLPTFREHVFVQCSAAALCTDSVTVRYQTSCQINDIKHHVMKTRAEMEVNLHAVLTLAVDKSEESASRCGRFNSDNHCITGTTGPTAALDRRPDTIPGRSTGNVGTCNTDRAIPALARTRCVQWQNFPSFSRRLF